MRPRCWCLISFTQLNYNFGSVATGSPMARLYKACPQESTTELCEAATAVRTISRHGCRTPQEKAAHDDH